MKEIDKILHLLNYADDIYSKAMLTPEESKQLIDYINAQKAEVEKLKADLIVWKQDRFNLYQRLELYEKTRQEVAREIFEEVDSMLDLVGAMVGLDIRVYGKYAELKKKYTEGESNGSKQ